MSLAEQKSRKFKLMQIFKSSLELFFVVFDRAIYCGLYPDDSFILFCCEVDYLYQSFRQAKQLAAEPPQKRSCTTTAETPEDKLVAFLILTGLRDIEVFTTNLDVWQQREPPNTNKGSLFGGGKTKA